MTFMGSVSGTDELARRYADQYERTNDDAWVTMDYKVKANIPIQDIIRYRIIMASGTTVRSG